MIVMKLEKIKGDCQLEGYTDWITLDDVSWDIAREPKESFNKGATTDLNFGIAEAAPVSVKKAMDVSSCDLMKMATGGGIIPGKCEIHFIHSGADSQKYSKFLEIELERPVVKKWSIDGSGDERPTENIELLYNKITMAYTSLDAKGVTKTNSKVGWDLVSGKAIG
jgi:type VI protein secretion system component Hcp